MNGDSKTLQTMERVHERCIMRVHETHIQFYVFTNRMYIYLYIYVYKKVDNENSQFLQPLKCPRICMVNGQLLYKLQGFLRQLAYLEEDSIILICSRFFFCFFFSFYNKNNLSFVQAECSQDKYRNRHDNWHI